MTVFQWSGTGYRAEYNDSHTAVFTDDDDSVDGRTDNNESVSIDGGSANITGSNPYKIAVSFTDTEGNDHVEDFNFFYTADGGWYFAPQAGSEFTEGATLGSYQSHTVGWDYDEVVCFAEGTLIQTKHGLVAVEDLQPGQLILTNDDRFQPLVMNMSSTISQRALQTDQKLRPVRISAGAMGNGLPHRDLLVSRQHRMLVQSKIAERMFGKSQALISAIKLTELPGIFVDTNVTSVTYHHLLFEDHEVVFAEGAPSESLFTGKEALKSVSSEAREEMMKLFPELADMEAREPACFIPTNKEQKHLVERHVQNARVLLDPNL